MKIERFDLIIVGAGPSGLSAAIEAAKRGMKVVVFDENARPGGQLFKQIHKYVLEYCRVGYQNEDKDPSRA